VQVLGAWAREGRLLDRRRNQVLPNPHSIVPIGILGAACRAPGIGNNVGARCPTQQPVLAVHEGFMVLGLSTLKVLDLKVLK
jgi:hypothetical protein